MALKHKISKQDFDALPEAIKAEYLAEGEGYRLDVTGLEDTGALKRAKDRETQLRKEAETKLGEAEARITEIESTGDARKDADIKTLEKSWQAKLDKVTTESKTKIDKLSAHTTKSLVDNVVNSIATKISTSPALISPHLRARIVADLEGDEPVTKVLDKDGKPSEMTIDQLQQEFVANKDFSAIIIGSKASGGAGPSRIGGGASQKNQQSNEKPADLSKMKANDLVELIKDKKAQQSND